MKTLTVGVVTPSGPILEEDFEMVVCQTETGEIGILPDHIPIVTPLIIGMVRLKKNNETVRVAVGGGFMEVNQNKMTILAKTAESAESIDVARAQEAKKRAEERLSKKQADVDFKRAELALQRAINRIKTSGK